MGVSVHSLGRAMASKAGFNDALKDQRASLAQAVALFPELRTEKSKGHTTVFLAADSPLPRAGTLDAFAR